MSLSNTNISAPPSISLSAHNSSTSDGLGAEYAPANKLGYGYGVGEIVRGAISTLANAWQSLWSPPQEKLTDSKQITLLQKEPLTRKQRALEQTGFPSSFDLSALDGSNGFKVEGLAANDNLGSSVSTAGDLNGDGKADLVLGAWTAAPGGRTNAGTAYIIFGQASGLSAAFNLNTLNGSNGFKVEGLAADDRLGSSVSTAGDLNGDGKADLVLGAYYSTPGGRTNAGTAYIIFGQASGFSAAFNLATLNGSNGFKVEGLAANDNLGSSVSTAGDLNGDGKADLVLGAYAADPGGRSNAGTAYIIFGQSSGLPAAFNLTSLNGSNGFKVEGLAAGDFLGSSVSTAGDLNGDDTTDLVLGAYGATPGGRTNAGTAYIIWGQANGFSAAFNLSTLNGSNGFKVEGLAAGNLIGKSFNTAGDLNGDGTADLVLGAYAADPGGRTNAGTAYIIWGQANGFSAAFNLSTLNGSNGFKVEGLAAGDYLGSSVTTAGDLNGDGKADLVLGAYNAAPGGRTGAGMAYVLYGINASQSAVPPPLEAQTLGIALGVSSVVLLGGLAVVLVVFKQKKMACFSNEPKRRRDSVQSVKLKAYS